LKSLSLWDRAVFGAISGVVGALLGLAVALLGAVAFDSAPAWRAISVFSAVYFFAMGAIRGADAGFFVGDALSAVAAVAATEVGAIPGDTERRDKPSAWGSVWSLGAWLTIVAVIAWRG
jgi:hypothetical protein